MERLKGCKRTGKKIPIYLLSLFMPRLHVYYLRFYYNKMHMVFVLREAISAMKHTFTFIPKLLGYDVPDS